MAFANETQTVSPKAPEILGADAILEALKTMPMTPGVYRMLGAGGDILYVGKAKSLKNRVGNYTSINQLTTRIMKMVEQVARVDILTCASEAEALMIEANLIRRHKPRYNILLKDDKSFPHLFISGDHPYPRIAKHRGAQNARGEYFGPFASVGALNETLVLLQKIFQLRPCEDTVFKGRTRPCLQYQIKRCSAPCVGYVNEEDYRAQLIQARDFLRGKHRDVQDAMVVEMQQASAAEDYEAAARLRDRIQALTRVQQEQAMNPAALYDADILVMARKGARSVIQLFLYREGTALGHQTYHPRHEADATDGELMAAFIGQFYQGHVPAPLVLVSHAPDEAALLEEALKLHAGHAVRIQLPLRGDKFGLIQHGMKQATAALDREELQRASVLQNLHKVKELFGLATTPQKIEVYDNSHISGTHALGAMIVATPEGFDKRCYRKFTMKGMEPGDDYAMMREMFRRRFKHADVSIPSPSGGELGWGLMGTDGSIQAPTQPPPEGEEKKRTRTSPKESWAVPDLLLIDGGKGHLSAVTEVMAELGMQHIPLVGIAKGPHHGRDGREWFFMNDRAPFQLPENDGTLHYLQRLRDEAHRFAIGAHRNKRSKALTVSALDDIPGIGALRKKALLHHFGSRAAVERATLAELQNVPGVSKKTAEAIHEYFRS